jgi:cell division septation protein DedD
MNRKQEMTEQKKPLTAEEKEQKKSELLQALVSSVATLSAGYVGSLFGLTGTGVGTVFGAVASVAIGKIYLQGLEKGRHSASRIQDRITQRRPRPDAPTVRIVQRMPSSDTRYFQGYLTGPPPSAAPAPAPWYRKPKRLALAVGAPVVLAFAVFTVIELALGHPISGGDNGTTLSALVGQPTQVSRRPTTTEHTTERTTTPSWTPTTITSSTPTETTTESTPTDTSTTESAPTSTTTSPQTTSPTYGITISG